jgi:hypothetical protein
MFATPVGSVGTCLVDGSTWATGGGGNVGGSCLVGGGTRAMGVIGTTSFWGVGRAGLARDPWDGLVFFYFFE